MLRTHVEPAVSLARAIDVTPQAALGLLRQLTEVDLLPLTLDTSPISRS